MSLKSSIINERIKKLIEHFNLNPNSLAARIGTSNRVVRNIVGGRRNKPGFDTLKKIMQTFDGINAHWLLTGEGEMFVSESTDDNIILKDQLSPDYRKCQDCKEKDRTISKLVNQISKMQEKLDRYEKDLAESKKKPANSKQRSA